MGYIGIIDYGAGNLMSVSNALDFLGFENKIVAKSEELLRADKLILPGVGAFPDAMAALEHSGLLDSLMAAAQSRPFLGICLGMQMLFEESDEIKTCRGLGFLKGRIEKIETSLKLPQIGWNSLENINPNALTNGINNGDYVYFVHSFKACPAEREDLSAVCDYGAEIPAIVSKGNLYGCQFHPEKSGEIGLKILKNFACLER